MPPAALLVCSVDSTRWPVSADWIGDARGLEVAHFADHDDVRVLAHDDAAQRVGEVQPDLRLGLDLVDALDLVFDRVLDGDDLDVRLD